MMIFILGSCNVTQYLGEEEYLVKKNKVIIDDKAFSKEDPELIYNLESLILQKRNRDYFFIPREWLYYRNREEFESSKKKKGWVKNAERPVIHSDKDMFVAAEEMEKYLRFSKGYYNARVYPKAFLTDKKAFVEYYVTTEKGYTVRSKEYFSQDETVMTIINGIESSTLIKSGTSIDESVFDSEKGRITSALQQRGYANFGKNHIDFQADSSDLQMDVFVTIKPPENDSLHRRYTIGEIKVYADFKGVIQEEYNNTFQKDSVQYLISGDKFFVKPITLDRAIQFRTGQVFKKSDLDNTYTALANLGTFRFINIGSSVSAISDTIIDYSILLSPITEPWALESSLDLYYSYFVAGGSRLGIGLNGALSNDNAFGGGEKFRLGAEVSGESFLDFFGFSNFAATTETGLTYPRLIDPVGHIKIARWSRLLSDKHYEKVKNKTTSDTELNYSFISNLDQYSLHSVLGKLQYKYKPEAKITWLYTTIKINSLSSAIDPVWQTQQLDNNTLLERSLDPVLITGFLMQEVEYSVDNPVFSNGFSWSTNIRAEQSGSEIALANWLYNGLPPDDFEWVIDLGQSKQFLFSKYILGDIDLRAKQRIIGKHDLAGRVRGGVATPLNRNAVIPFIRQFFVGGANSLRGWNTRELGPGAYSGAFLDTASVSGFFQTGDIVLEANVEYRFPIYSAFEGAVFLDAGNVWTLREDVDRPGAQFLWDEFYNQIAVNYGVGVRLNLDFLIFRIDFGQKLRYPFPFNDQVGEVKTYWHAPEFTRDYLLGSNFAFGLNYPF